MSLRHTIRVIEIETDVFIGIPLCTNKGGREHMRRESSIDIQFDIGRDWGFCYI